MNQKNKTATFAAGCFWGVEKDFSEILGVIETEVGYAGGFKDDPTYKDVCSGNTGHAEAVQLQFDSNLVSYDKLLEKFWMIHDPTQKNRQGSDVGSQYRSAIFYHDEEQRETAEKNKIKLDNSGKYKNPIVTIIEPAKKFWRAEEFHQKYLMKNNQAACRV
jgi:peptide-methionine (S)-S-oxide reductase